MDKKKLDILFACFEEIRKIYGSLISINIACKLSNKIRIKTNRNNIYEYPTISLLTNTQFVSSYSQIVNSLFNLYEKYQGGNSLISTIQKELNYLNIDRSYFSKPYSINIAALRHNFTAHINLNENCYKIIEKNTLTNQIIWEIFDDIWDNFKSIIGCCNFKANTEIPEEVLMIYWWPNNKKYVNKFTDKYVSNLINFFKGKNMKI